MKKKSKTKTIKKTKATKKKVWKAKGKTIPRVTSTQAHKMLDDRKAGMSIKDIAVKYGRAWPTVQRAIQNAKKDARLMKKEKKMRTTFSTGTSHSNGSSQLISDLTRSIERFGLDGSATVSLTVDEVKSLLAAASK